VLRDLTNRPSAPSVREVNLVRTHIETNIYSAVIKPTSALVDVTNQPTSSGTTKISLSGKENSNPLPILTSNDSASVLEDSMNRLSTLAIDGSDSSGKSSVKPLSAIAGSNSTPVLKSITAASNLTVSENTPFKDVTNLNNKWLNG